MNGQTGRTRVVLVDDHSLFRRGLRMLLEDEGGVSVVGEASSAREAYEIVDRVRPDLLIVDVALPGIDGITATRELLRRAQDARVLILSVHDQRFVVGQALEAGALGYLVKTDPPDVVLAAIRRVERGQCFMSPQLTEPIPAGADCREGPLGALSQRECEVFRLLVRGFSNQRVAKELYISIKTVETHRTHIHRKLGVHSIAELIRFAADNGQLIL